MFQLFLAFFCSIVFFPNFILSLDSKIFWGTYKPHLLFALSQKTYNSLTFGFFYFNQRNIDQKNQYMSNVRFKYSSNHILARYLEHNAFDYAYEQIEDKANYLVNDIKFLKENFSSFDQQSWKVTIDAVFKYSDDPEESDEQSKNNQMIYVFYVSQKNFDEEDKKLSVYLKEYKQNEFAIIEILETNNKDSNINKKGYLKIEALEENCLRTQSFFTFLQNDERYLWDVDNIYYEKVIQSEKFKMFQKNEGEINENDLENDSKSGNLFFLNFFLDNNCKYAISYNSEEVPGEFHENLFFELEKKKKEDFYEDFQKKFMEKDFSSSNPSFQSKLKISRYAFSNIIGGITHYFGYIHEVNNIFNHPFQEVFSCTPSRGKFPRGFLWDEGFHLLIVCRYSLDLCMKILQNWFDLMDFNGWIAREQIRNEEVAYGLEERFIKQDNYEGNPPTLIFSLLYLIRNYEQLTDYEGFRQFMVHCYNKAKLWFFWFLENQTDDEKTDFFAENNIFSEKMHFRWHCKGDCHNGEFLGSGLDDFPRQLPGTLSIAHLDLHTWILFFSESLIKISKFLNRTHEMKEYHNLFNFLKEKLNKDFLDQNEKIYKDIISLEENNKLKFNDHFGYINLFPLFFGYINDKEVLKEYFKKIYDYEEVWTDYGIRSLSRKSRYFGTGDNYWRGPIWIPINFLLLRGLKVFYYDMEEARNIYIRLRDNIIRNLIKNFENTGLVWETYHANTGNGQREAGFCGWSALITLIIKEDFF